MKCASQILFSFGSQGSLFSAQAHKCPLWGICLLSHFVQPMAQQLDGIVHVYRRLSFALQK